MTYSTQPMVQVYPDQTYYVKRGAKDSLPSVHVGYELDPILKHNLDKFFVPAVKAKWDGVLLVTGLEGSGKSTIAATVAHYTDPRFNLNSLVFTPKELLERIDDSHPGESIVFDEAVMGMLSQDAATSVQNVLIKKFVTIRKKRLFIYIVIPSIFLLRKYFAIFRTRALIHTFSPDGLTRGYFKFYNYNKKRLLYVRGIKEFDQGVVEPDFIGKFQNTEGYFFSPEEYDVKKEAAIKTLTLEDGQIAKLSAEQQRHINERHLFLLLAYKLYKHHIEWSQKVNPHLAGAVSQKATTETRFARFIEEKLNYRISSAKIQSGIVEGVAMLRTQIERKSKHDMMQKVLNESMASTKRSLVRAVPVTEDESGSQV